MAIQARCDCGEILRIPRPAPGEEWKCPSCGATIQGRDNGEEPADAMEIPIEGSSIGPRQEVQGGQAAGSALSGQGDSGKKEEDLEDDLEEPEEPEEYEGSRNGIPKGMLWGVFLVLLGLLGMIFLLKPGTREEPPGPGGIEAPRVEAPAPVGEDASVRIALEPSPGKEAAAPQATPLAAAGSGSSAGGEIQTAVTPQAPPQGPAAAEPPQPDAPPAAPSKALEPAAGAPGSSAVPAAPTAPAVQAESAPAAAAPQPKAQPAKPEKLAYSKPAAAKPAGAYTLNVGSFKARKNAEALREDLEQKGIQATVTEVSLPDKGTWYRVSVGRFSTPDAARRFGRELEKKWQIQSFVAQLD